MFEYKNLSLCYVLDLGQDNVLDLSSAPLHLGVKMLMATKSDKMGEGWGFKVSTMAGRVNKLQLQYTLYRPTLDSSNEREVVNKVYNFDAHLSERLATFLQFYVIEWAPTRAYPP